MPKLPKTVRLFCAVVAILIFGLNAGICSASPNHFVYVFPPGSIDVYDMDNGFSLVKSVPFPLTKGQAPIYVRGAVASAATGMLYLSYNSYSCSGGELLKYDLVHDTVLWTRSYSFGIDSMSISPDGQKIYMPTGESCYQQGIWEVIDANTGNPIGQINSLGGGPHNTITSLNGAHVYMGPRYTNYLVLGDTSTLSVIRNIGPVSGGVRPFTINAEETYSFITTSGKVGFYVGDIKTGQILYWVCPPGFCWTSGAFNGISGVSHGVSLSPDEREVYLIDLPNNHLHVFDVTGLPGSAPIDVADISLNCKLPDEGWLQHSRDGRFVVVGDCGDVIDTSTRKIVANMPTLVNTRIYTEVDFQNGVPSFSPLSRNQGGYVTQPTKVSLSSSSLSFGNQTVGSTSSAQSTTLTNNGASALAISGIAVTGTDSGDFAATNTCGSSLAAGGNCTISATFTPTATGTRTAAVTITDSDASSPQVVNLAGTGVGVTPVVGVSPASLTFSSQTVGTKSAAQTVTVTNTGNAALAITGISASGDYGETNSCGSSLAAGGNCTISVTFTPTAAGTRTGSVSVADNASGSPQMVSLTGTGASPATPTANVAPTSLTFDSQTVGTTSAAQTVTLTNTGGATLTINSVSSNITSFAESNNCGSALNAGGSCTISVTFSPNGAAGYAGMLTITDNASGSPQTVSLTGTGVSAPAPAASVTPASLTFNSQTVGTASAAQTVTLTNTGNAVLTITGISASGDYGQTNNCAGTLAASAKCTISVTFTPTAAGTRTGSVSITDNASGSPQMVSLTGTGSAANAGNFSVTTSTNSVSTTGGQPTNFTVSVTPTGGFNQAVTVTCQGAPQAASCSVTPGVLTPTGAGAMTATVMVTTTAHSMQVPSARPRWIVPPMGEQGLELLRELALLALLMLASLLGRRKQQVRWTLGAALLLLALVSGGCSGLVTSSVNKVGTPPGNYPLTVTATSGSGASAITHSATVTLTVN